jgi:urease accessory protein
LVLVDWLCSGRVASGERWAFQRFKSRNEVFCDGCRVLVDSLLLDPADGPLDGPFRMGRFNCLALVLLFGALLREQSARLLEEVANAPLSPQTALVWSASPMTHGALVRLAGASVETVAREIRRFLAFLPELLRDDPWSRKW